VLASSTERVASVALILRRCVATCFRCLPLGTGSLLPGSRVLLPLATVSPVQTCLEGYALNHSLLGTQNCLKLYRIHEYMDTWIHGYMYTFVLGHTE
jgi:hypothetical protein